MSKGKAYSICEC